MSEAEIQIIDQIIEENKENYYCLLKTMLKELKRINNLNSTSGECLIIERPSFRIKSNKSIFDKTIRKDIDVSKITQFKDILGIRVICLDIIGLDKIYSALKTSTIINVIEEKRWVESADNDGYRGIHLIFTLKDTSSLSNSEIKAEIQIRTVAQHFWASFSHRDIYKTGNILNPHTFERVHQLSDILYMNELEVQRLDLEIKQDPLTVNIPRLKSLLDSLMISNSTPEL
jgi:ppGpp synthetase/RelA/SpoT-type nucleotidyltranferase